MKVCVLLAVWIGCGDGLDRGGGGWATIVVSVEREGFLEAVDDLYAGFGAEGEKAGR